MSIDIYTEKAIQAPSKEHIIPNFLGGQLISCELIDKFTNDYFGGSIDAALAQALRPITVPLDARSDRKPNEPAPAMQATSVDGETYEVRAGGVVRPTPKLDVQVIGRELHINGSAPGMPEIRQALRKKVKQLGLSLDEVMKQVESLATKHIGLMPKLTFPVEIWNRDPYRATAKIACNQLGMHEQALFLRPEFNSIRQFVMHGTQPEVLPVQVAPVDIRRPESAPMGRLDHLVIVHGTAATGQVTGLVTYFGLLSFVVNLATCTLDKNFSYSYRVDQFGRSDRQNASADLKMAIPSFESCARLSYEEFRETALAQLNSLLPEVFDIQRQHWLRRIILPYWEKAAELTTRRELTPDEHWELATAITVAIVRELEPSIREASRLRRAEAEAALEKASTDGDGEDK